MTDVVVIGGGIAGLAAAYELTVRRIPFVLLEGSGRLGGVVLSEHVDGFVLDGGPDALLVHKRDALTLCEELGLTAQLMTTASPRTAYVQRGGTLHALPDLSVMGIPTRIGPFVRTRLFSWPGKIRMGMELFVPPRTEEADESIGALMRRRFGQEAVDYLAEPLLAGIHAGDVDRLSAPLLFPRFVTAERTHGSLLRAFRRDQEPRADGRDDGPFRSLPGGLGDLVRAIEKTLPREAIRLHAPVTRLAADPSGGYVVSTPSEILRTRVVILAVPAYAASTLTNQVNPELARLCGEISYVSTATISLAFERSGIAHPLNGSGFLVPRVEGSDILAASWMSSKWPHRAPEGRALIRAFVGGARDPQALDRSDRDLVARALNALTPLLGVTTPPLFSRVYRWPRSTAQYEVGHGERIEAIERALVRSPGLYLTGSAFRGNGIPNCIADGRRVAGECTAQLGAAVLSAQGSPS